MSKRAAAAEFVMCIRNTGYKASLVLRRVYRVLPDAEAQKRGLLRVVDESGEDYLFPAGLFVAVELPRAATKVFSTAT